MSAPKHTAGPWWLVEDFDQCGSSLQRVYSVHANDQTPNGLPYEFAGLARVPACEGDEKLEANARLIAAAPDLLEACKILDAYLYATAPDSNERQIVAAAIEKAVGA